MIGIDVPAAARPSARRGLPQGQPVLCSELTRTFEILLVEDNAGDVRLTREALRDAAVPLNLSVVGDGLEALAYLRRSGRHSAAARPNLILLDVNLPRKDGWDVLAEIKHDADLRPIPVVVLTTSQSLSDVQRSYQLQANAFVSKPGTLDEFLEAVRRIGRFWLETASLPHG